MADFREFRESRGDRRPSRDRPSRGFNRGSRGGFRGGSRDGPKEKFDAVCGKCGEECQVPFKPRGDKPVLCSNCFEKQGNTHDSRGSGFSREKRSFSEKPSVSVEQFKELSEKVDKILKILSDK